MGRAIPTEPTVLPNVKTMYEEQKKEAEIKEEQEKEAKKKGMPPLMSLNPGAFQRGGELSIAKQDEEPTNENEPKEPGEIGENEVAKPEGSVYSKMVPIKRELPEEGEMGEAVCLLFARN